MVKSTTRKRTVGGLNCRIGIMNPRYGGKRNTRKQNEASVAIVVGPNNDAFGGMRY